MDMRVGFATHGCTGRPSALRQRPAHHLLYATTGETIRPGGAEVVRGLLSETLLLPVYKDVCADVHAHFQRLVQPTLSAHSWQRCGITLVLSVLCTTEVHIRVTAEGMMVCLVRVALYMKCQIQPTL